MQHTNQQNAAQINDTHRAMNTTQIKEIHKFHEKNGSHGNLKFIIWLHFKELIQFIHVIKNLRTRKCHTNHKDKTNHELHKFHEVHKLQEFIKYYGKP